MKNKENKRTNRAEIMVLAKIIIEVERAVNNIAIKINFFSFDCFMSLREINGAKIPIIPIADHIYPK